MTDPAPPSPWRGPWRVEVSARARRDVHRLPPRIAPAIAEFVTATLPENPERVSRPLTGKMEGLRSVRRGDYRVIFDLRPDDRVILVARIGHRAHIYRPE